MTITRYEYLGTAAVPSLTAKPTFIELGVSFSLRGSQSNMGSTSDGCHAQRPTDYGVGISISISNYLLDIYAQWRLL